MHTRQVSTSENDEYDTSFGNRRLNKVISENSPFKDLSNPSIQVNLKKGERPNTSKDSISQKSLEDKENNNIPSFYRSDQNSLAQNISKHSEIREMMTEFETVKYKYSIVEQQNSLQQDRIQNLEKDNEILTRKYEKLKSDHFILKNQFSICKKEIERSFDMIENAKLARQAEIDELRDRIHELTETNQILEEENESYRAKISQMSEENAQDNFKYKELLEKYNQETTIFDQERKNFLTRFKETQDKYYEDIQKLGEEKNNLQKQRAEYLQSLSELDKKHTEYIQLDLKMKEEIAYGKMENERLSKQIEALNSKLQDEKSKQEIFLKHEEDQKTQLQSILVELSSANHKNLVLERENQKLRQEIYDKSVQAAKDMERSIYELSLKHQQELEGKKNEIEDLRYKISTLKEEKEGIQSSIEELKKEFNEMKKTTENEKERYSSKISNLKKALRDSEKEHKTETDNLLKKINDVSEENKGLIEAVKRADEEYNRLQEDIFDFEAKMEDQYNDNLELRETINLGAKEKDHLLENIKSLNNQISSLVQRDDERVKLQIREQEHLAKIKALEMAVADLRSHNEELERKAKSLMSSGKPDFYNTQNRRVTDSEINPLASHVFKKNLNKIYNDVNDNSNSTFRYESVTPEPPEDIKSIDPMMGSGNFSKKNTHRTSEPPEFISRYEDSTIRKNISDAAFDIKKLTQKYNDIKNKFNYDL